MLCGFLCALAEMVTVKKLESVGDAIVVEWNVGFRCVGCWLALSGSLVGERDSAVSCASVVDG